MKKQKKVKYITPANTLKQIVGSGGIPPEKIEKGQKVISDNKVDFVPYATDYLKNLDNILNDYYAGTTEASETIEKLSDPIMQLKANGGMFGYHLISNIADIMLILIENIEDLDEDAITVIRAHQNSLQIIVSHKLKGNGGAEGRLLEVELQSACDRFYKKHTIEPE